jgi:hypothetical protein
VWVTTLILAPRSDKNHPNILVICSRGHQVKKSFDICLIAILFTYCIVASTPAQHTDYLPLTKAELGKPFPIVHVGAFDPSKLDKLPNKLSLGVAGADFKFDSESDLGINLSGKDHQGKSWLVYVGNKGGLGGDFFTADLDKNGLRDFIYLFYTGGNGLAPTAHIFTLMFDSTGRPVPFEADGYFDWGEKTIADLVDMNGDGKAELIYMNFNDGYWITNLYQAGDGRWDRVKGQFAKRRFPLYTRFTNRPNHQAVTPKPDRHPFAPQLANKSPLITGRMTGFTWSKDSNNGANSADGLSFIIQESNGKTTPCEPNEWYGSAHLVIDNNEGRQVIALWSDASKLKSFLEEIIKQQYQVSLYGKRFADKISPELIWATK